MALTAPLPWHAPLWALLLRSRAADRLPHALLLAGPAGVGKARFAERLVQALLCHAVDASGDACGRCAACQLYQAGTHPDLRRVVPEEAGKAIRIDAVRDLIGYLSLKSQYGGYKIAVVAPAERMNSAAANALLKTLEEPAALTLLLLVCARPSALPATVRSRCQTLVFAAPERGQAVGWLREQGVETPEALLDVAGGAPLTALALAGSEELALRRQLAEDLGRLDLGDADPVALAARYNQLDIQLICSWLLSYVGDMIRLALVAEPPGFRNADLLGGLIKLAKGKQPAELFAYRDALLGAQRLAETAVNTQLMLEELFVRWSLLGGRR